MKKIAILFSLFVIIIHTTEIHAQNQPKPLPDPQVINPPDGWFLEIFLNNKFRIGGLEAGASTYGYSVGLPVFWVKDQVKIVPMAGWFWQTHAGWSGNEAVGGKILYYLQKQRHVSPGEMNIYAGISNLAGWDIGEHQTGLAVGMEPFYNRYFKLGLELQLGLRGGVSEDRVYGGVGVVVGFGW